ncbi:MAG: hypothetical protein GY940_22070 [bacterium]|nr:hypothetical protein [bacterium]
MNKRFLLGIIILVFVGLSVLIFLPSSPSSSSNHKSHNALPDLPYSAGKYRELMKQGDLYFSKMHLWGWREAETNYNTAYRMKKSPQLRDRLFLTLSLTAIREKDEGMVNPQTYEKIDALGIAESSPNRKQRYLLGLLDHYRGTPASRDRTHRITSVHKEYVDISHFDIQSSPLDFYLYLYLLNYYTFDPRGDDDRLIRLYRENNFGTLLKKYAKNPLFLHFSPRTMAGNEAEIGKNFPRFAEFLLYRGDNFFRDGKLIHAFDYYKRAKKLIPGYGDALNGLGNIYYFTVKHYEKAIEHYNETLQFDRLNPKALFGKGVSLHHLKQWDDSNRVLDLLLENQDLYHGEAYYFKAYNDFLSKRFDHAGEMIREAKKRLPRSGEVNNLSGQLYYREEKMTEAVTDFLESLEDDRYLKAYSLYYLGMIHLKARDWLFFDYFTDASASFKKRLVSMMEEIKKIDSLELPESLKKWMKQDRQKKYYDFKRQSQVTIGKMQRILARNKKNNSDNPLHKAAMEGNIPVMEKVLQEGAAVDTQDKKGYTPLYVASMAGQLESVRYLLDHGASVNVRTPSGFTPLHEAAFGGRQPVAELLIAKGAEIYAADRMGVTPVQLLGGKFPDMVNLLAPVHAAVNRGDTATVKQWLEEHNTPGLINTVDHKGHTLLHLAVIKRNKELVRWLLDRGADPNIPDSLIHSPLSRLEDQEDTGIRELLESRGAKANVMDFLRRPMEKKKAVIWYAFRNVWMVKTSNNLLVFNYLPHLRIPPANFKISKFFVKGDGISPYVFFKQKVVNFLSHRPLWHPNIDEGLRMIPSYITELTTIKGWSKGNFQNHIQTWPGHSFNVGDVEIRTVKLAEDSMGYWVKTDGLVIFYAGDITCDKVENIDQWITGIQAPVKEWGAVDIVFLPVHGRKDHVQTRAALEILKTLKPRLMFPLYDGSGEHYYREFAGEIKKENLNTTIHYAEKSGQRFNHAARGPY